MTQRTHRRKINKRKRKIYKKLSGVNALRSFEAIMTVVNRHRPYEPDDFIPESYIPDLD